MQRLGYLTTFFVRGNVYSRIRPLPTLPTCGRETSTRRPSSSAGGQDHDDFWTAVKTEAEATPAYQKAASIAACIGGDGVDWATPGNYDATPQQRPAGEAYRPYNNGPAMQASPQHEHKYNQEPIFDMESSMHLSPTRQVVVKSFQGKLLVNIRQFFKTADGEVLPTKKGISLTVEQWRRLQAAIHDIDNKIAEQRW